MSNAIEPLTNTIWDTITLLCKSVLDVFNIKHIDFDKFFNEINIKNKSGEIPQVKKEMGR